MLGSQVLWVPQEAVTDTKRFDGEMKLQVRHLLSVAKTDLLSCITSSEHSDSSV